jgi:hypothetical protein
VKSQRIIDELGLRATGNRNWYNGIQCPFCGRRDKFGLCIDSNNKGSYHCFRASCGSSGTLWHFLKKIGRDDLISVREYSFKSRLEIPEAKLISLDCEQIPYPMGFRKYKCVSYLESRGWQSWDYKQFEVGKSTDPFYKNYILFCLKEKGKLVGFLGRSKQSKEWHRENPHIPRYKNSRNVDFSKIVGGIEEICENDTVIICEGIMDAVNINNILRSMNNFSWFPNTKAVFTNGSSISETQCQKLKNRGIKSAIFLYDADAMSKTQKCSLILSRYIPDVRIAEVKGLKDAGEFDRQDFESVLKTLYNPLEYKLNRLII